MPLLEVSGSWAETRPMEVPTRASSETTISLSGTEKMGGSFTSFTVTLMDVVSLNGPTLKKLESMFLFVASILSEKLLLVSKSRGWKRQKRRRREGRFISDDGEVLMDGSAFSVRRCLWLDLILITVFYHWDAGAFSQLFRAETGLHPTTRPAALILLQLLCSNKKIKK